MNAPPPSGRRARAGAVGDAGSDPVRGRYRIETAFGPLVASFTERGLARLEFGSQAQRGAESVGPGSAPPVKALARALGRYLSGDGWDFTVPLDLSRGTDFDRAVWGALRRIPPGETRTYGDVARALGRPRAARAVGNACGRNPVPVVVPCHRVVASGGIGGFGLGLGLKRRLLALEGVRVE
jgi:O-6-methylguanine DNA methyltransferase